MLCVHLHAGDRKSAVLACHTTATESQNQNTRCTHQSSVVISAQLALCVWVSYYTVHQEPFLASVFTLCASCGLDPGYWLSESVWRQRPSVSRVVSSLVVGDIIQQECPGLCWQITEAIYMLRPYMLKYWKGLVLLATTGSHVISPWGIGIILVSSWGGGQDKQPEITHFLSLR